MTAVIRASAVLTIIGLEHHTPENIGADTDRAVAHETVFHQFMLYTPMPGTPLHAQIASSRALSLKDGRSGLRRTRGSLPLVSRQQQVLEKEC